MWIIRANCNVHRLIIVKSDIVGRVGRDACLDHIETNSLKENKNILKRGGLGISRNEHAGLLDHRRNKK